MLNYEQTWLNFIASEIRSSVPSDAGVFAIKDPQQDAPLVIEAAANLRKALLDALPPLGSTIRLSANLAKEAVGRLKFCYRVMPDQNERDTLANTLTCRFKTVANTTHWI